MRRAMTSNKPPHQALSIAVESVVVHLIARKVLDEELIEGISQMRNVKYRRKRYLLEKASPLKERGKNIVSVILPSYLMTSL